MTEAEWDVSLNSQAMLEAVRSKGSERLWRLFAVACVRRIEHLMPEGGSRQALEVAERFADGTATRDELRVARGQAQDAASHASLAAWLDEVRVNFGWDDAYAALCQEAEAAKAILPGFADDVDSHSLHESLRLPDVLREVFGNPFRWTLIDPVWLLRNDGAARTLAQTIYDRRAFEQLPILADALEDAGCSDDAILSHLRSPARTVRGCWAIDLILGKE